MKKLIVMTMVLAVMQGGVFAMRTEYPIGVTIYKPEKCWNGYTLLNQIGGLNTGKVIFQGGTLSREEKIQRKNKGEAIPLPMELIDMNGKAVHSWNVTTMNMRCPQLLDNGHLLMSGMQKTKSVAWMNEGHPMEYDWDSKLVWETGVPVERHGVGGFVERLENGNTLFIYKMAMPDAARMKISDPERRKLDGMLSDCIAEVTPDGEFVWDWKSHDHLDLDGWLRNDPSPNWTHFNNIQSLPENKWFDQGDKRFRPGNILVSGRTLGYIFIIEKSSGEIVWRYYGDYMGGLSGQHSPNMISKGYPGEGNILVFDNGQSPLGADTHGGRTFILEINPTSNKIEWLYDNGYYFFASYGGDCERLPNGNTLIAEPWGKRVFEVTMEGEIVWEYVGDPRVMDILMDATRVPYDYTPQLAALPKPKEKEVAPSEHTITKPLNCGRKEEGWR